MHFCISLLQCLLLSSLYQLPQVRAAYPSDGVNLDYCRKKEDCAGSRQCFFTTETSLDDCNATANTCFCRYPSGVECSSSADCPDRERCIGSRSDPSDVTTYCSTCRLQLIDEFFYADEDPSNCEGVWLGGYTGDICVVAYLKCAGERTCGELSEDGSSDPCSFGTKPCFCWPDSLKACSSSQECEDGERCAENAKGLKACFSCGRVEADDTFTAVDEDAICTTPSPTVSATQTPSPSASLIISSDSSPDTPLVSSVPAPSVAVASPPCIAVVHLSHVEKKDLIFHNHSRAAVFCDRQDSCATPGHMVVYNDIPMSMYSYCSKYTKCTKRTAWVNNPRMRRGFRVPSNTDGLHFTVFSARYETRMEESFLRVVISFGM